MKKIIIISIIAVICLAVIVVLMSQPSHQGVKYYLQIKINSTNIQNSLTEVEINLFHIIIDRLSNLRGLELVNSLPEINNLVQSYKTNYSIPRSVRMSEYLGREDLANCYLEWESNQFNPNLLWINLNIFKKEGKKNISLSSRQIKVPMPKDGYSTTYSSTLQSEVESLFIDLLSK